MTASEPRAATIAAVDAPEEVDEQVVQLDDAVEEPVADERPTFGARLTGLRPR